MSLDTGKGKIQKICDVLKKETIEPAKKQAEEIIENAHMEAKEVMEKAEKEAQKWLKKAEEDIEHKKKVFHSSLQVASKQAIESLKQTIEKHLFSPALSESLKATLSDPSIIAKVINSVVHAIEKEGIDAELEAYIPKEVPSKKIAQLLLQNVKTRLKNEELTLKEIKGGAQIKLIGENLTLDMSKEAIQDLLAKFVRNEFRELLFS